MQNIDFQDITKNPELYYIYYDNECINTLDLIKNLESKNVSPAYLLPIRMTLARQYAKRSVIMGILKKKPQDNLIRYWDMLQNEDITKKHISYEGFDKYQAVIKEIEKFCIS